MLRQADRLSMTRLSVTLSEVEGYYRALNRVYFDAIRRPAPHFAQYDDVVRHPGQRCLVLNLFQYGAVTDYRRFSCSYQLLD